MQKLKKGFHSIDYKKFILHVVNNNIAEAVERYNTASNELDFCNIKEIDSEEDINSINEKRMVLFLHDILQDEPLKELEYMMEKWQNYELKSTNNFQPILPEDIIKNYSILIKTIISFLGDYNHDLSIEHQIVSHFEELEQNIEWLVFDTFKEIQKKATQVNPD